MSTRETLDNMKLERRMIPVEFRVEGTEKPKIIGHAAVFNKITDLGWFKERIAPGAFSDAIKQDDVRATFNHDPNYVLGRNTSKTLSMSEDDVGLAIDIDPPDTQWARDLQVSMKRGDITQMSFAFRVIDAIWETIDGDDVRTLKKVQLFDVAVVTYPAYPETDASVRSLQSILDEHRSQSGKPVVLPQDPQGRGGRQGTVDVLRRTLELKNRL